MLAGLRRWLAAGGFCASLPVLAGCPDAVRADGEGSGGDAGGITSGPGSGTGGGGGNANGGNGNGGNGTGGAGGGSLENRAVEWTAGCAYALDAYSQQVDFGGGFTVEFWFLPTDDLAGSQVLLFNGGTNTNYPGYSIERWGNAIAFCATDGTSLACTTSTDMVVGRLYHIVAVTHGGAADIHLRDSEEEVYVAGTTAASFPLPATASLNMQRFGIGGQPDNGTGCESGYFTVGVMDELRIWSEALTKNEFDLQVDDCTNVPALRAYYRFDEPDEHLEFDDCASDIALTLVGPPSPSSWQRVPSPLTR